MDRDTFLSTALTEAIDAVKNGAPIRPAAAVAHAANETGWGKSGLTTRANNLFGVKAIGKHTPYWQGDYVTMPTWEVVDGANVIVSAPFRRYSSWAESFGDYGDVIRRVYPKATSAISDVEFLAHLFVTGPRKWATDPNSFCKCATILGINAASLVVPDDFDLELVQLYYEDRTYNFHPIKATLGVTNSGRQKVMARLK